MYSIVSAKLCFFSDIDVVFVKDFSYHLTHKYGKDTMSFLPSSFKHSFLIRTPYKTVTSGYRVAMDPNVNGRSYGLNINY